MDAMVLHHQGQKLRAVLVAVLAMGTLLQCLSWTMMHWIDLHAPDWAWLSIHIMLC